MNIKPYWSPGDYQNLNYQVSYFKDSEQVDKWRTAGHNIENTRIWIAQLREFDTVQTKMLDYFPELSNIGLCFHRVPPGNYLPTHVDKYGYYRTIHNIESVDQIIRAVVFLEDWADGHYLTVDGKIYSNWSAGDVVKWRGLTPHSAINFGMCDRYTLQVTGVER